MGAKSSKKILKVPPIEKEKECIYKTKLVRFLGPYTPIILQKENGSCMLIAMCNLLLLRVSRILDLSDTTGLVPQSKLISQLQVHLSKSVRKNDLEKLMKELLALESENVAAAVDPLGGESSSSTAGEITSDRENATDSTSDLGHLIKIFSNDYATQLANCSISICLEEKEVGEEPCVFFGNNHFSTMLKYNGELYRLVTDHAYDYQPELVWENLEVNGFRVFRTGDFKRKIMENSTDFLMGKLRGIFKKRRLQWDGVNFDRVFLDLIGDLNQVFAEQLNSRLDEAEQQGGVIDMKTLAGLVSEFKRKFVRLLLLGFDWWLNRKPIGFEEDIEQLFIDILDTVHNKKDHSVYLLAAIRQSRKEEEEEENHRTRGNHVSKAKCFLM